MSAQVSRLDMLTASTSVSLLASRWVAERVQLLDMMSSDLLLGNYWLGLLLVSQSMALKLDWVYVAPSSVDNSS